MKISQTPRLSKTRLEKLRDSFLTAVQKSASTCARTPPQKLKALHKDTTELANTLESKYLIRRRDIRLRQILILDQTVDYGSHEGEVYLTTCDV